MSSQALGVELNVYLPVVDNQSDYLDFTHYPDELPIDAEYTSSEMMDDEATTLNQAPHTGHSPGTTYYPPTTYTSAPAPVSGHAEEEEDDTSMSDTESDPPFADGPAVSVTPHPFHPAAPLAPLHYPAPAADFSVNPNGGPTPFNPPMGLLVDSEGLPYAPGSFHVDAADSEGLIPGTLPPQNPSLFRFLELWADTMGSYQPGMPWYPSVTAFAKSNLRRFAYHNLRGDRGDIQGIDWIDLGVSRDLAREYRIRTYKNFVNIHGSDTPRLSDPVAPLPSSESYYRFHNMHIRGRNVRLNHFQLRHILASSTRNRSFYPEAGGIRYINPLSGKDETFINLRDMENGGIVSTLAATSRVLVAATFNGEYCIKNLDSAERGHHTGKITEDPSGITTQVQVYPARLSGAPTAAFASNDRVFRTLDVATQQFLQQTTYNFPINCSALSPDRRLRLMVGDHHNAVVANAETGEILRELSGHWDYGFSCDWADDGWTVATGSQDMTVRVWDARRWCNSRGEGAPVATLRSEMAGVRNLKFSPVGSGKRVLVAAEEADFVSVVDARSFDRKQTLDLFGEIGGVDFCDGGRELQVLCCDWARGGLMRFERCDWGREGGEAGYEEAPGYEEALGCPELPGAAFDWGSGEERTRRRKRAARAVEMEPF